MDPEFAEAVAGGFEPLYVAKGSGRYFAVDVNGGVLPDDFFLSGDDFIGGITDPEFDDITARQLRFVGAL